MQFERTMSSQVSFTLAKRGAQWRVRVFTPPGGGDAAGSSGADNGGRHGAGGGASRYRDNDNIGDDRSSYHQTP